MKVKEEGGGVGNSGVRRACEARLVSTRKAEANARKAIITARANLY